MRVFYSNKGTYVEGFYIPHYKSEFETFFKKRGMKTKGMTLEKLRGKYMEMRIKEGKKL